MTQKEFIQQAMISMCSNPSFAPFGDGNDFDQMIANVEDMADKLGLYGYSFDGDRV